MLNLKFKRWTFLILCYLIAACASPYQSNQPAIQETVAAASTQFCLPAPDNTAYLIGIQDKIKVSVLEEKNLSGEFVIDGNGFITMPLVGDVGIAGCTVTQARQIITDHYADGYLVNPNISVEIEAYSPIYIIGEVRAPGKYDYSPDMTILKAVALAGGFTYRANQKSAQVLRKDNLGVATQNSYPANSEIKPGDIITIKERLF